MENAFQAVFGCTIYVPYNRSSYWCTQMYLGDVPEVEEVMYLGWSGKKKGSDAIIQL